MNSSEDLRNLLRQIDHRGYPAYKSTAGSYRFSNYVLSIDHVQGDPFASPSDVGIHIAGRAAGFPEEYWRDRHRRVALADRLVRAFGNAASKFSFQASGSGKSGLIQVSRPGQEILERSACTVSPEDGSIVLELHVGFPAQGRTINSRELEKILFDFLPKCAEQTLFYRSYDREKLKRVIDLADDQKYIRGQLKELGLVAFVADGAILPRESGISDRPMRGGIPFVSPESMAVTLRLPRAGDRRGMGIPRGITMIAGGGYHGKSTLLKALELGVYDHIAGDGREYVITDASAVKLRAEDGRSITGVDISMFIRDLPNGKDTVSFSTEDASGSTSQAANVAEAIETGSSVFLIDEDTSATNFMIRDELMQRVITSDSEPIIPFIDRVEELYRVHGISTVLVVGSCGTWFYKADHIIQMKQYLPVDITEFAKKVAGQWRGLSNAGAAEQIPKDGRNPAGSTETSEEQGMIGTAESRQDDKRGTIGAADGKSLPAKSSRLLRTTLRPDDRMKIRSSGVESVSVDREEIDLRYVEQICDREQTALLGAAMKYAVAHLMDGRYSADQIAGRICTILEREGIGGILGGRFVPAGYAVPRKQEIAACINRFRRLTVV
ncbi:MAG: ABC-ATPase domain-containing protein [Lachnospiraceae bacterium]|nr:ABC-ATPase domain-containing protein [Lachnospiraceae bacterium]